MWFKLTKLKADRLVIIRLPLESGNFAKYCSCAKINSTQTKHCSSCQWYWYNNKADNKVSLDMQGFKEQQQIILWSKEYWKISSPTVTLLSLGLLCNTTYYTTDQTTKDMWSLCNRWSQDFTLNWILTKISFQKKSDILLFHNIFTPSVYLLFSKHKCVTLIELIEFALSKKCLPYNKVLNVLEIYLH